MAITSSMVAVVSSQLGRVNRWLPLGTIIRLAFVVYAVSLVLIPFMPGLWYLIIPGLIFGVAQGVNIPSIQTSIASLAPFEYRAAFMSINATIIRMGQAIGPLVIGLFYIYGGFEGTFYGTAALALLAPIVAMVVGRAMKSRQA